MLRRRLLIAAAALPAGSLRAWTGSQTDLDIYRNAAVPLEGSVGDHWEWPGNALSASTVVLYGRTYDGSLQGYAPGVAQARWVLVWNPNTRSVPTGVRLVQADFGPKNIVEVARSVQANDISPGEDVYGLRVSEVARFERAWYASPRVESFDISEEVRKAVLGPYKVFGHQTIGNGRNGCLIYGSWIEVVWKLE